jgi:hypothetical protein
MTWTGLTQDLEHLLFMSHLLSISNDKEEVSMQEIWNAPIQIA